MDLQRKKVKSSSSCAMLPESVSPSRWVKTLISDELHENLGHGNPGSVQTQQSTREP